MQTMRSTPTVISGDGRAAVVYESYLRDLLPWVAAAGVIALLALPLLLVTWLGLTFELEFLVGILIYSVLTLSLDLAWGYGGIISLAQGTFFGVGAYAMAYALEHIGGWQGAAIGLAVGISLA